MQSPSGNHSWEEQADVVLPRLAAPSEAEASAPAPASEAPPADATAPAHGWSPTAWRRSG